MDPLQIAAFWDNRPGHIKQTRGILDALGEITDISVTDVSVPIPGLGQQAMQWFSWLAGKGKIPGECESLDSPPDLILGTGTHTHLPMLHYARLCKAKAATCMTPSSLLVKHFNLSMVPYHDNPGPQENLFPTLGPPNTGRDLGKHDPAQGLLAVGGIDQKSHHWNSDAIMEKVRAIIKEHGNIHWTVTSSFRTPQDMLPKLGRLQDDLENCAFFKAQDTQPGWIEEQYSLADTCWVTADSVSMVYEALSAGCKVGVIPVDWKNPDSKIPRGLARLYTEDRIVSFADYFNNNKAWKAHPALDEAGRSAREILRRWWPDRLQ